VGTTGPMVFLENRESMMSRSLSDFNLFNLHGAPPGSIVIMTPSGYMTDKAWEKVAPACSIKIDTGKGASSSVVTFESDFDQPVPMTAGYMPQPPSSTSHHDHTSVLPTVAVQLNDNNPKVKLDPSHERVTRLDNIVYPCSASLRLPDSVALEKDYSSSQFHMLMTQPSSSLNIRLLFWMKF
jgi:hypothetical protein